MENQNDDAGFGEMRGVMKSTIELGSGRNKDIKDQNHESHPGLRKTLGRGGKPKGSSRSEKPYLCGARKCAEQTDPRGQGKASVGAATL